MNAIVSGFHKDFSTFIAFIQGVDSKSKSGFTESYFHKAGLLPFLFLMYMTGMAADRVMNMVVLGQIVQIMLHLHHKNNPAPAIRTNPRSVKSLVPGPPVWGRAAPALFFTAMVVLSSLSDTSE